MLLKLFLVAVCAIMSGSLVYAETVSVAVASNFVAPLKALVKDFENLSGHQVVISAASSGKLYAQIRHGAPYQIFLSADQEKPRLLEADGFTEPGSRFTYALGALVLWSSRPLPGQNNLDRLQTGNFKRLALANPRHAPYGMATVQVLQQLELESQTRARWVMGENISQSFQFVSSANAELGFVARSQLAGAPADTLASSWLVPQELHDPIRQDAVLLTRTASGKAAPALLEFMRSEQARKLIASFGYRLPLPEPQQGSKPL